MLDWLGVKSVLGGFTFKLLFLERLYMLMIAMPRGKRRKIEVPRDTQPQFESRDTSEDIERRRREREEREGREQEGRNRERIERGDGRKLGKDRKATTNRHRY